MEPMWTCAACATVNGSTNTACVVCHVARPVPGQTGGWSAAAPGGPAVGTTVGRDATIDPTRPADPSGVPVASWGRSETATPAPPEERPKGSVPVAAIAAAVVLFLAVAGGVAWWTSSGGEDDPIEPDLAAEVTLPESETVATEPPEEPVTTTAPPETTSTAPDAVRPGRLFSGGAKLRAEPRVNAGDLGKISGREGAALEVIGSPTADGWYKVRIDGVEGYLFGAFVLPPAPGFCVGTSVGKEPVVRDDTGQELFDEKMGNKVLTTATTPGGAGWPVVLPGGRRGYVPAGDLTVRECG